ncbi:hypothetical protein LG101_01475 [Levilactobacillus brevis]|nr:hypothetical protein LG101_01475 [Levilactobacillus brevis]
MVNTILKEADLFCPNSVRINFTIYHTITTPNNLEMTLSFIYEFLIFHLPNYGIMPTNHVTLRSNLHEEHHSIS